MTIDVKPEYAAILRDAGLDTELVGATDGSDWFANGDWLTVTTPVDNTPIARVKQATEDDYEKIVQKAEAAFQKWRTLPAPRRGEIIREINEEVRARKEALGKLVSLEAGKIVQEGMGEVQEVIDIGDFAVGLSRQLYGLSMHSERPGHRMYEQWHPLGVVGIISAFNFPIAVWSWNSFIAGVCGDTMVWKPSSKTPLVAIAMSRIANDVLKKHGHEGVMTLVVGAGRTVGERMLHDHRLPLISATGSCRMGTRVYESVAKRMGRALLELGGNNGIIVTENADLDLATRAIVFGAVGTAGQRCTSTRRIIAHKSIAGELKQRLVSAYGTVKIGNPLEDGTLLGPLVDEGAVTDMMAAVESAKKEGGVVVAGGTRREDIGPLYVEPTIIEAKPEMDIVKTETFAPILYFMEYDDLEQAIGIHNNVPQGLSSAIFTTNILEAERFLTAAGSDCGIANVNIGTSGAEIGGAFGGEKETGGGREAGSDSWKQYMRRQTCTINYTKELPLSQGIKFHV